LYCTHSRASLRAHLLDEQGAEQPGFAHVGLAPEQNAEACACARGQFAVAAQRLHRANRRALAGVAARNGLEVLNLQRLKSARHHGIGKEIEQARLLGLRHALLHRHLVRLEIVGGALDGARRRLPGVAVAEPEEAVAEHEEQQIGDRARLRVAIPAVTQRHSVDAPALAPLTAQQIFPVVRHTDRIGNHGKSSSSNPSRIGVDART
jgi:hypothetical protein